MMTAIRTVYHLMRADFLERVRRFSFLVLVGLTTYFGYLFTPTVDAGYQAVTLGNARGVYNSAWVGTMYGMMISTILSLLAFFVVKGAVDRDRQTKVGQIIASTPVSKVTYVLGKWLSNLAVLTLVLAILTGMAVGMQLVRAEETHVDLWALAAPIWFMGLPVMAIVAALAVSFEVVPFLSGGFGNVVFLTLYMAGVALMLPHGRLFSAGNDLYGMQRPMADMADELLKYDPGYDGDWSIGAAPFEEDPIIFPWEGIAWTAPIALERLVWLGLAAAMALAGVLPFDRFDPARRLIREERAGCLARSRDRLLGLIERILRLPAKADDANPPDGGWAAGADATLTPLGDRGTHWRFGSILGAELRLMLKKQPWWWYGGVGVCIFAGLINQVELALAWLRFAWLWPLLVWSMMGAREARHFTAEMVFSAAHPLRRQLAAKWLAGAIVALLLAAGIALRLLLAGEMAHLAALLVGALFVSSLALALGVWSNSPRLFEMVYLLLWYGAFNGIVALDFMGINAEALTRGCPLVYLGLTLALLLGAALGRWRQLQS